MDNEDKEKKPDVVQAELSEKENEGKKEDSSPKMDEEKKPNSAIGEVKITLIRDLRMETLNLLFTTE